MALRHLEVRAGVRFRDIGMDAIADAEPMTDALLDRHARDGHSWVAIAGDQSDRPIGYLVVEVVDGLGHVEQVSVDPDWQGRGVGRRLVDAAVAWARGEGRPALTLTTFIDVPWNRPLYEHLGFRVLADDELGPELRAVRDHETAAGLDPAQRVCMRLDIAG